MPTFKTPGVYIKEISMFPPSVEPVATAVPVFIGHTEKAEDEDDNALYNAIKTFLTSDRQALVTLPPSGAIAGIYARTDRERGVFKAPANVSLLEVIEPVIAITDGLRSFSF